MKHINITIKHCTDCFFADWSNLNIGLCKCVYKNGDLAYDIRGHGRIMSNIFGAKIPEWCPLADVPKYNMPFSKQKYIAFKYQFIYCRLKRLCILLKGQRGKTLCKRYGGQCSSEKCQIERQGGINLMDGISLECEA